MKETEEFLAAELSKLSAIERTKATEDVHCVGGELEESPELVERSLLDFDAQVKRENDQIYGLAVSQNRAYVENRIFRLKFLRADLHDVKKAVRRMMKFLNHKLTSFGVHKLTQEITLADLNEEDIFLMKSGLFHIQEDKDQSGRIVIYVFNRMLGQCTSEALIRVAYYIWWNILIPLPDVQLKGLVGVYYDVLQSGEQAPLPGFNFMLRIMAFTCSLPMRYSGVHCCIKRGIGNRMLNENIIGIGFSLNGFDKYARVRTRMHCGSDIELQYKLQSHGINIKSCPVDTFGRIREEKVLNAWFYEQAESERERNSEDFTIFPQANSNMSNAFEAMSMNQSILCSMYQMKSNPAMFASRAMLPKEIVPRSTAPRNFDVLLGRGKSCQNHGGNIRFRKWLDGYHEEYDKTPRNKRRLIVQQLSTILLRAGVRFLKEEENNKWVEADPVEAEKKISQLFRSIRKVKANEG